MAIPPQLCLLDRKTYYPAWTWTWTSLSLHSVGLGVAGSIIHAGFLDWASNLTQLRDLERVPTIQQGVIIPAAQHRPRRRVPRHVRRLFLWGFIGLNAAVTAAWAYAADDATATATATKAIVAGPNSANMFSLLFRYGKGASNPHGLRWSSLMAFMVENMALLRWNLDQGRWWTLLTCGLSHPELGHLLFNMGEFYVWASRCFDLGVGVGGVVGLMLGSGVCCGLAALLGEDVRRPGLYFGASGIVCGLQAAAILLEPIMGFRVPDLCDVRYPLFFTLLTGSTGDLVGLLLQRLDLAVPWLTGGSSHKMIGYLGHLGGTAFGVAYWYSWLRPRFGTW